MPSPWPMGIALLSPSTALMSFVPSLFRASNGGTVTLKVALEGVGPQLTGTEFTRVHRRPGILHAVTGIILPHGTPVVQPDVDGGPVLEALAGDRQGLVTVIRL